VNLRIGTENSEASSSGLLTGFELNYSRGEKKQLLPARVADIGIIICRPTGSDAYDLTARPGLITSYSVRTDDIELTLGGRS
jgi:hypothetical protein